MHWKPTDLPSDAEVRALERERERFLVDEGLGDDVAQPLAELGWKAVQVADLDAGERSAVDVLEFALSRDLVLLTRDRAFLDDARYPLHLNPGVIVLPDDGGSAAALSRGFAILDWLFGPHRTAWRRFKCEIGSTGEMSIKMRHADTGQVTTSRYRFTTGWPPLEWVDES